MEVLKFTTEIDETGKLKIDLPTNLKPGKVDLIVVASPVTEKMKTKNAYDFSDLVGKLNWQGDALAMQKKLRNEW